MTTMTLPHRDTAGLSISRLRVLGHTILRVGAGLLFMQHGAQKLFGVLGGFGSPGATAPMGTLFGLAGILEFFGGALLVLGLLTRPVAVLLAGEMLYAFVTVHAPQGGAPVQNGGELALLYAFIFAFLAIAGGGRVSLDRIISDRRASARNG